MVNIGEYYLFQPVELDNENISAFDRRNPIDYKRTEVKLNMKAPSLVKTILPYNKKELKNSKINEIKKNYDNATEKTTSITRGETNWYIFASFLNNTGYLNKNFNITDELYKTFIIETLIDMLSLDDLKNILDVIYYSSSLSLFEKQIKAYLDSQLLENKGIIGLITVKDGKQYLIIKGENKWEKGEQEDYVDLANNIKEKVIKIVNMNNYVGFIGNFKNEYNIFKVKNLEDKRSKGARCDQSGKSETIKLLNTILGETKYTPANTKGRNKTEFCIIQEMILRYNNKNKLNNKTWFLTPQEAIINNIEKASF